MNITFVGGGNMAAALIGGLLGKGHAASGISVVDPADAARQRLAALGVNAVASPSELNALGNVVVLAVKPQQMRAVCNELQGRLKNALVLSIAAGIRLSDLARWLGGHAQLARCMPNTPALVGRGVSGVYAADAVSNEGRTQIETILAAVGQVVWVDAEQALDAVTAISGSGPAYVFYFIEALQQAGVDMGLDADAARMLTIETFRGAAELAAQSSEPVSILRERVTSKGGTTEHALARMRQEDVARAIVQAAQAARARAAELGDELGRDS